MAAKVTVTIFSARACSTTFLPGATFRDTQDLSAPVAVFHAGAWRIRQFTVERFAIFQAAAQKNRPFRHSDVARNRLGQQASQLRMMPAQSVSACIAVFANTRTKPHDFGDQFILAQIREIAIRDSPGRIVGSHFALSSQRQFRPSGGFLRNGTPDPLISLSMQILTTFGGERHEKSARG